MEEEINKKLDELFLLLDKNSDIKKINAIKGQIDEEEMLIIQKYRDNPSLENKKKLYENQLIRDYLISESNLNYLIMQINSKFKGEKNCESNKW